MRIGIDATCLPHNLTGAGRYISGLIQGLAQHNSSHEFFVYCKKHHRHAFGQLPEKFTLMTIGDYRRPMRIAWQLFYLPAVFRRDRLDLWHATHYIVPVGKSKIPIVTTIHDLTFFKFPAYYDFTKRYFFPESIRRAVKSSAALLAVSRTTLRDLQAQFPEAPPCHLVYCALDPAFQSLPDHKPRQSAPYLLAVGTQEKRKQFSFLVRVFAVLAKRISNLKLVLVGPAGNDTPDIQRAISENRLEGRVVCTGFVSQAELVAYYCNAAVVCLPSAYEGFGFPVVEALAAATPVLVSDRPAMTEIGGEFVHRAPFGEREAWVSTIENILQKPPPLSMRKNGQQWARQFSLTRMAKATLALYESLQPERSFVAMPCSATEPTDRRIELATARTVAYADVFDYPLTAEEVHAGLIECAASQGETRWALQHLVKQGILQTDGLYFFLSGRSALVRTREQRLRATASLLSRHRRGIRFVLLFPFIKAVAISGAAAFGNATEDDDLDLFIVTSRKRLWIVYTLLVLCLKICGLRHKLCLNYLISEDADEPQAENFFIAHQIVHLRPLLNQRFFRNYRQRCAREEIFLPNGGMQSPIAFPEIANRQKPSFLERIGRLRIFDACELIFRIFYGGHIARLTRQLDRRSIEISSQKIMLFTNNHLYSVLEQYHTRLEKLWASLQSGKEEHDAKENGAPHDSSEQLSATGLSGPALRHGESLGTGCSRSE